MIEGGRARIWLLPEKVTNNEGEYIALIASLLVLKKLGIRDAKIFSDSELVVNQVNSLLDPTFTPFYQIKKPELSILASFAVRFMKSLGASLSWLPREENKAGIALEEHQKAQRSARNKQKKEEKHGN